MRSRAAGLITAPKSGGTLNAGESLAVRGHAWAGDRAVSEVHLSIDFGATWQSAALEAPVNRLAWQHFDAKLEFPGPGYYEVWARATDDQGVMQPFRIAWNPKGYLNNSMHRVAVNVSA